MCNDVDRTGNLNAQAPPLVLPRGLKPLRRRIVWGVGLGLLVERLDANAWVWHSHACWQVVVTFSPAVCEVAWKSPAGAKGRQKLRGCHVWIMPPGWLHSIHWPVSADVIVLYVEPGRMPANFQGHCPSFFSSSLMEYTAAQPQIAELCAQLRELGQEPEETVSWRVAGLGTLLAAFLVEAHLILTTGGLLPFTGLARQVLEKMREYIAQHGTERVPVRALARSLGISPRHFRRVVRQITGRSPQEFVTMWKIQHAKNLLQSGTHNVSEAAMATGFSDPAHLNRRMQAIYGVSPKAFLPRLPRPFRA